LSLTNFGNVFEEAEDWPGLGTFLKLIDKKSAKNSVAVAE
jgi:hypothetical protein